MRTKVLDFSSESFSILLKRFFFAGETKIDCLRAVEVILLDKTDRKGRPNGDTQAVYVKLPTIFSRKMILMYLDCWTALIRWIHFFLFLLRQFSRFSDGVVYKTQNLHLLGRGVTFIYIHFGA